jgi:hypothetical protein
VGDGTADDDGVTDVGRREVGDVAAATGDEPQILGAAHGRADEPRAARCRDDWVSPLVVHTYNRVV